MAIISTGIVTPDLTVYTDTPRVQLGTRVTATDGSIFEYCQVLSAVAAYNVVGIANNHLASNLTTTLAATVRRVGVAQISIASSNYGWIQRSGKMRVNVAQGCNDFVQLFTTGTAGVLDDATVSEALVLGINLISSTSTASAVTAIGATDAQIFPYANPA